MSRIDRIYISQDLSEEIESVEVKPIANLQHRLLIVKLSIGLVAKRGPSYWKINFTIIDRNAEYSGLIRDLLINFLNTCKNIRGEAFLEK